MGAPFAFELRGFRDQRLNGVYVVQESPEYLTRSGVHSYPTYWNQESRHDKPFFMYWQEAKARHAITPRFDPSRNDLYFNDLFGAVAKGSEEPGLAFYRPSHNEWLEYDLGLQQWFAHPQDRNISYVPRTREFCFAHHSTNSLAASAEGVPTPSTPRCVPAASTPANAPGTPLASLAPLGGVGGAPGKPTGFLGSAPGTPLASLAPLRGVGGAPGTPTGFLGAAPGTPTGSLEGIGASLGTAHEDVSSKRLRLEKAKKRAIEDEDFDLAKQLKAELAALSALQAQEDQTLGECCICLHEVETFYSCLPCGHACACEGCARGLVGKPCPICRQIVRKVNITHLAFRRPAKSQRRE